MAMYSDERGKEAVLFYRYEDSTMTEKCFFLCLFLRLLYIREHRQLGLLLKACNYWHLKFTLQLPPRNRPISSAFPWPFPAHFKGTQSNLFSHRAQNNNGPPSSTLIYYYKSLVVPLAEYKQCTTSLLSSWAHLILETSTLPSVAKLWSGCSWCSTRARLLQSRAKVKIRLTFIPSESQACVPYILLKILCTSK